MQPVPRAKIRRPLDPSLQRRPLRLKIERRLAHNRAGGHDYITRVRFGDTAAELASWNAERSSGAPTR
jgi:hypothetical protein